MTIVRYYALIDRFDATRRIAYLRDLTEAGSQSTHGDEWPLHFVGGGESLAFAAGDAIAFVAQLNKYDGRGRRLCTDLPSLAGERAAPFGTFIDPAMREETLVPPFTYRFEAPTEIVKQERLVRVFHLPVDARLARANGEGAVIGEVIERGAVADLARYRTLQEAGWEAVYSAWNLALPTGLIHVRVTFMRPIRPERAG